MRWPFSLEFPCGAGFRAVQFSQLVIKAHGITSTATYDTVALDVEVGVLSSSRRRLLEVLGKLDQLMPLLQTLEIHEVITVLVARWGIVP